jgi:hypothetical protein
VSLQPITLGPVIADPNLFAQLRSITSGMEGTARAIERAVNPLQRLGASMALLARTEPRRRRLIAQLGTRNAPMARGLVDLRLRDAVAVLDAVEHDAPVEDRLAYFVALLRAALTGVPITRRQVRRARLDAQAAPSVPMRRARERRVDRRSLIDRGCTSRPRAPGHSAARSRATSAPARPVRNPRGSPV